MKERNELAWAMNDLPDDLLLETEQTARTGAWNGRSYGMPWRRSCGSRSPGTGRCSCAGTGTATMFPKSPPGSAVQKQR